MFGLSFTHLVILGVLMLVFIGPEQLPEVARTIARLLNEWKRASSDLQSSITHTFRDDLNKSLMIDPKAKEHEKVLPPQPEPVPSVPNGHSVVAPTAADDSTLPIGHINPDEKKS
jgi:sec-independent protein translocase protein TatB